MQNKTAFKGDNNQTNSQIEQLEEVRPDFAVKTPIAYTKTDEINFPYEIKAHCYKLENGQRVIIVPQDGETVLRTYVNTGSMNEPDKIRGISHYIEHNLFNGSKGLEEGDFFNQVNKMGASTNASTGFAETNYYISSNLLNEGDLENKIKIHASMLESPLFAVDKLEKEKGIVNSEINMITSDPQNIAINKMLKNLYGIKTSSADMIGGTTENITNLTRDDVVNYFNNNYYPANMVTVITGNVEPEETIKLISKYFTSKKQPINNRYFEKLEPLQKTKREDIISDKATASSIAVGFVGPKSSETKDRIYTEALATLLTLMPASRIKNKLKPLDAEATIQEEKFSSNLNDGRAIIFMAESSEQNSEKVLKEIFTEIGNISNNPPTDAEMMAVKKTMLKSFSSILENTFATNDAIGTSVLENNKDFLNDFEKIINNMSSEDLVRTAKKYFDIDKASVTLVHPPDASQESINKNHKEVSFTGVHKDAIDMASVKEYNTSNNYRLITANTKTDNVEIVYKLDTEKKINSKPSARLVLSEILNQGSLYQKQEEMDTKLAQLGIIKAFSAKTQSISCAISCDTETISNAFSCINEVINNPRFTQEEFEQAKSLIKTTLKNSEKSASDKLNSELFKGLPKGYSKQEILDDLDSLTLDDVKNLYFDIIKNSKGMISIGAPINRKPEIKDIIFNNVSALYPVNEFKQNKLPDDFKPIEEAKVLLDDSHKNQAEILQAYKFKINGNIKDTVTIRLLNTILGGNTSSRLFTDLREKEKLAYHVKSSYSTYNDIGLITLRIGTTTDNKDTGEKHFENVKKSIEGFKRHIDKISSEKVSDEELQNAKLVLKNAILSNNQSSANKISNLIKSADSPYSIFKTNMLFDEIDKITADDIQNAAKYIFSNKPTYSILATEDTLNANMEYLKSLEN